MHDVEETGINSAFFDALQLYKDNNVLKYFGIPWHEMKKLCHEEFNYIMQMSALATQKESSQASNINRELGDLVTKMRK